ncbi:anti-sigma factor antagonist [Amycolatopsis sp. YIM 10]|uniref:anti-sigma factor antagonist n=1 Tax=Amycolatopsis sp. YIM 10 TaxID=2653857 RepID=UPI0012A9F16E|nr:anti-sigma factor antagonist [Amycolatopsis sp. YIM 10]QFU88343.1 Anti-sigma-F factor antagonist RsfB [Amycolatopsis sp. YIM 10]
MTLRVRTEPPAQRLLRIDQRPLAGALVVTVSGDIDSQTAPALRDALVSAGERTSPRRCIVDLTAVTFLSAAGLTSLLDPALFARPGRDPCFVVDGNSAVIRPIEITGLDDELTLYHTVDEAVRAFPRPRPS